jgi:hypothetical protein
MHLDKPGNPHPVWRPLTTEDHERSGMKTEMERSVEVEKWKEGSPPVKFTFKKAKPIFELDDKSRKKLGPTLLDYFDSARTPAEKDIFNELITENDKIVRRMMEERKKIKKLRKKNKSLLPHVRRGKKILSCCKEGGRKRSEYYKELKKLYRIEAERLRNKGHLKGNSEIAKHITNNLPSNIENFLESHSINPLTRNRISRII